MSATGIFENRLKCRASEQSYSCPLVISSELIYSRRANSNFRYKEPVAIIRTIPSETTTLAIFSPRIDPREWRRMRGRAWRRPADRRPRTGKETRTATARGRRRQRRGQGQPRRRGFGVWFASPSRRRRRRRLRLGEGGRVWFAAPAGRHRRRCEATAMDCRRRRSYSDG